MSIKRQVTITCDGPCGLAVSQATVPRDWQYLTLNSPEVSEKGAVKDVAHLCPTCAKRIRYFLTQEHFALSSALKTKEEPAE